MDKNIIEQYLNEGKSTNEIAIIMGVSSGSTVRRWMKQYGLTSNAKSGRKKSPISSPDGTKACTKCGVTKSVTEYLSRKDRPGTLRPTCKSCDSKAVNLRTIKVKEHLIAHKGGKCELCERVFDIKAFGFHHMEPEHKDFNVSKNIGHSLAKLLTELDKCILVCHNCHAEIHAEMKEQEGFHNKIKGNTELWHTNKLRKLEAAGGCKCQKCGYNEYIGALGIIFPEGLKHYRKYNKTHWDEDFKNALTQATVLCQNCSRTTD